MFFKSLKFYRLASNMPRTAELSEMLSKRVLTPCSALDESRAGWVPPNAQNSELVHFSGFHRLICLGEEKKVLPAQVVKLATEQKAAEMEERQGYKVGRRQMREIGEAVRDDMLAQAFVMRSRCHAWIHDTASLMIIDTSSLTKADEVVGALVRDTGIAMYPLESDCIVAMTRWLAGDEVPAPFYLGSGCELHDKVDKSIAVSYKKMLPMDEIAAHIEADKHATGLQMCWREHFVFRLCANLQIKQLKPLAMIGDDATRTNADDGFAADFEIMTGELSKLIQDLMGAVK